MTSVVSSTERRGRAVAVVALGVLLVLVGVMGAAATLGDSVGVSAFCAFLAGVGVVCVLSALGEAACRGRRPSASLVTTAEGHPSTYLAFGAAPLLTSAGVLVWAGVLALAVAAHGLVVGDPPHVVLGGLVALGSLVWLLPVLLGGVRPGGVHLTPDGVAFRHLGSGWEVDWDDLRVVVPQEPVALVLSHRDVVRRESTSRYGWRGELRSTASDVLGVSCRHLSVDAPTLGLLLASYLERPDLRPQLGTPASLEWQMLTR